MPFSDCFEPRAIKDRKRADKKNVVEAGNGRSAFNFLPIHFFPQTDSRKLLLS